MQRREQVIVPRDVRNTLPIVPFHVLVTIFWNKPVHLPEKVLIEMAQNLQT